jgi:hypothetical protein
MTDACQYLHKTLSRLPRLKREDLASVPKNGIYVLFEKTRTGAFSGSEIASNLPARHISLFVAIAAPD